MSDYNHMIKRQRIWMLYLLAIFILGSIVSPFPNIFNSLLLGGAVSFYNMWNLQRNISRFSDSVMKDQPKRGIGTFTRLISAGLAIVIAIKFEGYFNLIGVIVGLIISYVVISVEYAMRIFTQKQ